MSKFIGIVSAYAYAVSQGYTGTEEEYAELMASYATVAEQASQSAQTASTKASEAQQSASTASTKATEATTAAGTAIDAKNDAVTAKTAAETAQGKAEDAQAAAAQSASEAAESARTLIIDSVPTQGSTNAVQSGGVYDALHDTDTTLSQSGQAADAKATGDAIAQIVPGLSETAKAALLNCFAHVAWVDEHGQDYYNELYTALYGGIPKIRVFVGKGIDGTGAIVDNANRALSEKIPLVNVAPITIKYPTNTDKLYSIKSCTSDTTVSSSGTTYCPTAQLGHNWITSYTGWCYEQDEFVVGKRLWDQEAREAGLENGAWVVTTLPSDMNGYIRLIFRGMADASSPIPSAIDKYIYINDVKYELVETDISEFE